ncbi:hypothetical protein [Actinoplanes solisilvae]|uniref:hypothetical protein n=1 Tax=Actinoplanes solisilvae TaxID=2486853 RepID=UPI001F0BF85A|nr:hypothetical protein [Actinoplanes solisilvae]
MAARPVDRAAAGRSRGFRLVVAGARAAARARAGLALDRARAFFPRHFPGERYTAFSCGSWLLDPQLLEYLPDDSNIARFQRRFELEPYEPPEGLDPDVEVLRFAFRSLSTPLDRLPRRTVLQRAIADHLRAGRHWQWRRGHIVY